MSTNDDWFKKQVEKARKELQSLPDWLKPVARFEGSEGSSLASLSPKNKNEK
jgi:hypothetical protein